MPTLVLSVLRCPDAVVPEQRRLTGGELTLGRGEACGWVLSDPDRVLSKVHCVLEYFSGGWQVRDTSTNGTFVNHGTAPVGRDQVRPLMDGDRLRVGAYEIEVRIEEDASAGQATGGWGGAAVDPFANAPAPPGFGGGPLPGMGGGGMGGGGMGGGGLLPDDFDPFSDSAPPMPDHAPSTAEAFMVRPVAQSGPSVIPDDWDLDLGPAKPAAAPAFAPPPSPAAFAAPAPQPPPAAAPPPQAFAPPPQAFVPPPAPRPADVALPPAAEVNPFSPPPAAFAAPQPVPSAPLPAAGANPFAPPAQAFGAPQPAPSAPPPAPEVNPFAPPAQAFAAPPPAPSAPPPAAGVNPFVPAPQPFAAPQPAPFAPPPAPEVNPFAPPPQPFAPPPPAAPNPFAEPGDAFLAPPAAPPPPAPAPAAAFAAPPVAPQPAPVAAPVPPAVPGGGASGSAALAALLAGADLPPAMVARAAADPDAAVKAAGALLRAAVAGIRALLIARADVKREFRIEQTMLRAANNNPLKFAATEEQALAALLDPRTPALKAMQETVDDLTAHQVATLAATQAAARALLDRLAPGPLEAEDTGSSLLPGAKERRLWEAYKKRHAQLVEQFEDDFDSAFGKAFARAYEQTTGRKVD